MCCHAVQEFQTDNKLGFDGAEDEWKPQATSDPQKLARPDGIGRNLTWSFEKEEVETC